MQRNVWRNGSQLLDGNIYPLLIRIGAGRNKFQIRRNLQHGTRMRFHQRCVSIRRICALHVAITHFVAQRPPFDIVGLLMTALGTQPAVFALGRAVAVFHPGGAYFGGIPGGIDGEEGLRADLPAEALRVLKFKFRLKFTFIVYC